MDLDQLHRRLADALGDGPEGLGVPGPLEELTGGWASTSVLALTLSHPDLPGSPSTRAVLKLYAADDAGTQHAAREQRALTVLAGTACRVPTVLTFEPDPSVVGRPYLLMEHVPGRSLWSACTAAEDDDERNVLVRSFVQPLVALHALEAGLLDPSADDARGSGAADAELAALHHDVAAFPRSGLGEVVRWLHEHRDDLACERPVVQHRDYHPWNAVVDAHGEVWVLDWDWQVGDPRFDVAWTCTLLERSGHDAFSAAFREEYARQSGEPLHHLTTFEVLTTVRWLLNVLPALGPDSQLAPAKREDFRAFLAEPLRRARTLLHTLTGLDVPLTP